LKNHYLKILILCAALLAANGFFQWLVDGDLGICWTHNVLRNWNQFGLVALKGQLVQNPGGHGALDHPDIYPGHRPTSLYPAYLVDRIFSWTGFYALPYHVFSTLVILLATAYLVGGGYKGFFLGGLAILSPGYLVEPTILDPNAVAILAGIPYAALLWWQLNRPQLKPANYLLLALLTLAFTSLNWTTALIHAQIFATLLICRTISISRLIFYVVIGAASAVLIVVIGLVSKLSGGGHGGGTLGQLLGGYMWGNAGYSDGSDTRTLLIRLAFINFLALLPMWLMLAWTSWRKARIAIAAALVSLTPLIIAILEAAVMRNYFSHHPWMAAPLLLVGWVFTMKILETTVFPATTEKTSAKISPLWSPAWSAGLVLAFGFGLAILLVNRIHASQLYSLVALVRKQSLRGDQIVVVESRDPQLVAVLNRLEENLDREVALVDTPPAPQNSASGAVLLSAVPMTNGWRETGHTQPANSLPFINNALEWFTRHISKRKAGDKMELADTYYLYYATPPKSFKTPLSVDSGALSSDGTVKLKSGGAP
jgi:hypothetical protein